MKRSEQWFRLAVTDRKGAFRGLEVDMPLRDALALEGGELSRGHDAVCIRAEIDADSWSELELAFARRRGLDRVVGARFSLVTQSHFADAEATFELLLAHFARTLGPPAPGSAAGLPAGVRGRRRWEVQGRELPTAISVALLDAVDRDMVRSARVVLEMERAAHS